MKYAKLLSLLLLSAFWFQARAEELSGGIQALPADGLIGAWRVAGRVVHVTATTVIKEEIGTVGLGACVVVKGNTFSDNSLYALEVEVRSSVGCENGPLPAGAPVEFRGVVQKLPLGGQFGDWQIGGRAVRVRQDTRLTQERGVGVGACAQVTGQAADDKLVHAAAIEVQTSDDCGGNGLFRDDWIEMRAPVERLPAGGLIGEWQIGGRVVTVELDTFVRAQNVPGACVEVKGALKAGGSVKAASIETVSKCDSAPDPTVDFYGIVQAIPAELVGLWKVSGRTVRLSDTLGLKQEAGQVAPGACVQVKGSILPGELVSAASLEVLSLSGSCFSTRAVVNAGSLINGHVSSGEIVSIFGFSLGPRLAARLRLENGRVASSLGGTRVLFDGVAAPMVMASTNQVNAVVPFGVAGKSVVRVEVEFDGVRSNSQLIPVVEETPGLFTLFGSGRGQGAIFNEDGSPNTGANPADRGSVVVLYATGVGPMNRRVQDGELIADAATTPLLPLSLLIGNVPAEILYAGAAPGQVAGMAQINARIPAEMAAGSAVPVVLKVRDSSSQPGVTLAVK